MSERGDGIREARGFRLRLNPVACDGVGMCARLAPDLVALDRWGYPIVERGDLDDAARAQARRAVRACPKQALLLGSSSR